MNILRRAAVCAAIGVVSVAGTLLLAMPLRVSEAAINAIVTESGKLSLSVDGLGTLSASGTIQVEKPAGGTVRSAHLVCATTGGSVIPIPDNSISLNGTQIAWDLPAINYADVTTVLEGTLNAAPAGSNDVTVAEASTGGVDGCVLAVIFNDPAQTADRTAVLLVGGQSQSGDTFTISLADPINTSNPNLTLDMGLGISYSYQGVSGHACGGGQFSVVSVNAAPLTNCAGNFDDGEGGNGALLTVGGIGDSNANPADPESVTEDDELYDLIPFVQDGDTVITVETVNPSHDDLIFFAHFLTNGVARVTTEICGDEIDNDGDQLVDLDDPDCQEIVNTPTPSTEPKATATPCIPPLIGYRCDTTSGGGGGGQPQPTEAPAESPTPVVSVLPATVVPQPTPRSGVVVSAPDTGDGSGTGGAGSAIPALIAMAIAGVAVLAGGMTLARRRA